MRKRSLGHYMKWAMAVTCLGIILTFACEVIVRGVGFSRPEYSSLGYVAEMCGETANRHTLYAYRPTSDHVEQLKLRFQQANGYEYSVNVIDGTDIICFRITRQLVTSSIRQLQDDEDRLKLSYKRSDGQNDTYELTRADLEALQARMPNKNSRLLLYTTRNLQPFDTGDADQKRAVIALSRNNINALMRELSAVTTGDYTMIYNPDQGEEFFVTSASELEEINAELVAQNAEIAVIEKAVYKRGDFLIEKLLSCFIGLTGLSIITAQVCISYLIITISITILRWIFRPH